MGKIFKPKPPAPPPVDPAVKKAKEEADKKKFELERQEKSSLFSKAGGRGFFG